MKVYLVRHGETFGNKNGIVEGDRGGVLTELGKKQAKATGEKLAGINFDTAYISDLARARKTAEYITTYHPDIPLNYDKRLRERSFGIFEGGRADTYFDYVKKYYDKNPNATFFQVPLSNGESLGQAQKRFITGMDDIWQRESENTILVVTHGAVIRMFVMYLQDIAEDKFFDPSLKISNCGVTILTYDKRKKATFEILNDVSHLKGVV